MRTTPFLKAVFLNMLHMKVDFRSFYLDMDQLIRVEKGNAMVMTGNCPHNLNCEQRMCKGDAVFVPARTWHNIKNTGKCPLRLSTIYAPPHHPFGTVEYTKEDA